MDRTKRIAWGASWRNCVTENEDGCLIWQGQIDPKGYGRRGGKLAHRLVFETEIGPIPDGLVIDHVRDRGCRSTACVNPHHLEAVTQRENLLRSQETFQGRNARKTHCPQGHPYDNENTRVYRGGRLCRACDRKRRAARRAVS